VSKLLYPCHPALFLQDRVGRSLPVSSSIQAEHEHEVAG
jgi:hypothetical protein